MGLKQLKRIRNNRENSTYDFGKDNYWTAPKQSYPGNNGWDWGTNIFKTPTLDVPKLLSFSSNQLTPLTPILIGTSTASSLSSAANTANSALGIATSAIGFGGSLMNSFSGVQGVLSLLNDAGTSNGSIGGINYTRLNNIDKNRELSDLGALNTYNTMSSVTSGMGLGASIGMVAGPVGGLIGAGVGGLTGLVGGLFGGASKKRKLRRKIYEAQQLTDRTNLFNRSVADSQSLQQDYALKYGNPDGLLLYANNGKDINNDFKEKYIFLRLPK